MAIVIRVFPRRLAVVSGLAVALLIASACGSSTSSSGAPSAGTSASSGGAGCGGGAKAGEGGVLHVFCDGTGTAQVTLGSHTKTLSGGSCQDQAGQYAINFGIAVNDMSWPSGQAKPDYIGGLVDDSTGALTLTVRIDGANAGLITNRTATLSADKKTGTLHGTSATGDPVTVAITC